MTQCDLQHSLRSNTKTTLTSAACVLEQRVAMTLPGWWWQWGSCLPAFLTHWYPGWWSSLPGCCWSTRSRSNREETARQNQWLLCNKWIMYCLTSTSLLLVYCFGRLNTIYSKHVFHWEHRNYWFILSSKFHAKYLMLCSCFYTNSTVDLTNYLEQNTHLQYHALQEKKKNPAVYTQSNELRPVGKYLKAFLIWVLLQCLFSLHYHHS